MTVKKRKKRYYFYYVRRKIFVVAMATWITANKFRFNFLNFLRRKRFVGEKNIFTNFSSTREAICCSNVPRNLSPNL